ncbi:hypothetical protein EUX98_g183 [Antrodiella citrinella]|uniref:Uncharacterized protein n=1 Tax=Antrodiella citrinella TaxID=2447956 RepID=A0A4V3XJQ6_9APHY|nr:hypothetical protein EUX98_g183 [Antrodiella citrinella]
MQSGRHVCLHWIERTSFTTASLAQAIWLAQGDPGNSCANQARLVDVAPGLDVATSPNRTQWGQAALLWDLVESNNLPDVSTLQKFVVSAPWSKLGSPDGATPDTSSKFTTTVSGWVFNFAAQTVTAPPQTFVNIGQPSSAQIAKVDDTARAALDRMYTFALASATQHQKALSTYWTAVLQQNAANLNQFLSRVRGSQILLPFDATLSSGNQPLSALLTNSSSAPFPPPLACYPGLSVTQVQAISTFETTVFNLSSVSNATKFDTSCFPDRPIYGVLDIAGLRLPFVDSRTGVAKQAAVLTTPSTEAVTRVVVYSGEVLGALPGSSNLPVLNSTVMDPRRFGTMNHLEHVILQYLQSIPDVNVAIALVEYVMAGSAAPPTSDNILFSGLATLPAIEVAVFGTIDPSDVDSSLSSLSDPGGKLFFGSDQSLAVRQWTIDAVQSHVEWTALATSSDAVEDSSFSDINFNEVWNPAFAFFHTTNQAIVGVSNITQGFCTEGKLPNC